MDIWYDRRPTTRMQIDSSLHGLETFLPSISSKVYSRLFEQRGHYTIDCYRKNVRSHLKSDGEYL